MPTVLFVQASLLFALSAADLSTPAPTTEPDPEADPAVSPTPEHSVAAEAPSLRWMDDFAGSIFAIETGATLATFAPDLQLSYNPTVDTTLVFLPRYALSGGFDVRARLSVAFEWTNSDFTRTRNEPLLSDLALQSFYSGLPRPLGVMSSIGVQVSLPTSKISQARSLRFSPALIARLARPFEEIWGGVITPTASLSYEHPFFGFTTPSLDDPPPYTPQCFARTGGCTGQASGVANASDILAWSVSVQGQFGPVMPSVVFQLSHLFPFGFADLDGVIRDPNRGGVRNVSFFGVTVGYQILSWLSAEVGYDLTRNLVSGGGGYGNPVFDRYQDSRLHVGLTLSSGAQPVLR